MDNEVAADAPWTLEFDFYYLGKKYRCRFDSTGDDIGMEHLEILKEKVFHSETQIDWLLARDRKVK